MIPITETYENAINGRLSHRLHNVLTTSPTRTHTRVHTHTHTRTQSDLEYKYIDANTTTYKYIIYTNIHGVYNYSRALLL